jgi:hypothetical protein
MSQSRPTDAEATAYAENYVLYGDQSRAWRIAFPSSKARPKAVHEKASTFHRIEKVQKRISQLNDALKEKAEQRFSVTAEEVVERYARWARFDPRDVFSWVNAELLNEEGNSFDPPRFKPQLTVKDPENVPDEAWDCIESINQGKEGFKINVVNRKGANDQLAKILGIEKQIIDHRSTDGSMSPKATLTEDQALALLKKNGIE